MTTPRYGTVLATARADIETAKKQVAEQHQRLLEQSAEVFAQASTRKDELLQLNLDDDSQLFALHMKLLHRLCRQFGPQHRKNRDATHISTALNQMRVMEAGQATATALDACSRFALASSDQDCVFELQGRLAACLGDQSIITHKEVPQETLNEHLLCVNSAQLFVYANQLLADKWRPEQHNHALTKSVVEALRYSQTEETTLKYHRTQKYKE